MTTLPVLDREGQALDQTVELPESIFAAKVNVALIHQVVVAQLAAARQGTHDTKTRGEVRGGGKKPYRQKGTGRARQGSIRAPQFVGGGTVHGPTPHGYEQKTPKKMKAAALRGALSDRANGGRVHVVAGPLGGDGAPSTKTALAALTRISSARSVLVVADRQDDQTWKSLRNAPQVHLIAPGQLNTYDVLCADDVVFTEAALATFIAGPPKGRTATGRARSTELTSTATEAAVTESTGSGSTEPAGAGVSDEELVKQVAGQTSSDLAAEAAFEREGDGATSDVEVAKESADDAEGTS